MKEKCLLEIDYSKIDDLSEWSVPLLKELKAEIEITAISNILDEKIGKEKKEEDKNKGNEEEKQKFEKEEKDDSSSSSNESSF